MFKSISFFHNNRTNTQEPIDIGNLVECMLFYGETTVFANRMILSQLLNYFGIEGIIELIEEKLLIIKYSAFVTGIHSNRESKIDYHKPVNFYINNASLQVDIIELCQNITGKKGKGRRIGNRLKEVILPNEPENLVIESTKETILNQDLILASSKSIITDLIPEPIDLSSSVFITENTENGITVETNFNFPEINKLYHKYIPESHSSISPASILGHILASENELWLASNNSSELSSSLITSNLIPKKVEHLINNNIKSNEQLNRFNDFVLDESKSLREFINEKNANPQDIITLLKKARKFKKWISGVDANQDLVKEYYKEVTKETWVDKLPGKTTRWSIFTGVGIATDLLLTGGIGTIVGTGIGAFDNFVVDKLIQGWKPNQFVREELKSFIEKK